MDRPACFQVLKNNLFGQIVHSKKDQIILPMPEEDFYLFNAHKDQPVHMIFIKSDPLMPGIFLDLLRGGLFF